MLNTVAFGSLSSSVGTITCRRKTEVDVLVMYVHDGWRKVCMYSASIEAILRTVSFHLSMSRTRLDTITWNGNQRKLAQAESS